MLSHIQLFSKEWIRVTGHKSNPGEVSREDREGDDDQLKDEGWWLGSPKREEELSYQETKRKELEIQLEEEV